MKKSLLPYVFMALAANGLFVLSGCNAVEPAESHDTEEDHDHLAESEHAGEAEGHEGEAETHFVHMDADEIQEFGVVLDTVQAGELATIVTLPGEILINRDQLVHVAPVLCGVVREVYKSQGDTVTKGEPLALLACRELAEAKAQFLAGIERLSLAQTVYDRELDLWKKKISSEEEMLQARRDQAEATIELQLAEQKLLALGLSKADIQDIPEQNESGLANYIITAPISGKIIQRHISLGEAIETGEEVFGLANLSNVWVDVQVFQKDLAYVSEGDEAVIRDEQTGLERRGVIRFIDPIVDSGTRTTTARIVLDNADGVWRPGLFITASVETRAYSVGMAVRKNAIQIVHGVPHVFVQDGDRFEAVVVKPGREDLKYVEILEGLSPGMVYAADGSFTLKAEMEKGEYGDGHNH